MFIILGYIMCNTLEAVIFKNILYPHLLCYLLEKKKCLYHRLVINFIHLSSCLALKPANYRADSPRTASGLRAQ